MSSRKCPTPSKQAHPDRTSAQRHLGALWAKGGRAGAATQHAYKCRCGSWHVGGLRKHRGRRP